jgi:magnesium transporter
MKDPREDIDSSAGPAVAPPEDGDVVPQLDMSDDETYSNESPETTALIPDEESAPVEVPVEAPSDQTATQRQEESPALGGLELPRASTSTPGSAPGIEHDDLAALPSTPEGCWVTCIDYSPDRVRMEEIVDLEDFILHHRPEWSQVRWINVDGLTDMTTIQAIAEKYEIHPLALEDVLHVSQRPKVDTYGADAAHTRARMVIITRMIQMNEDKLRSEQITIALGHKTVITFQETHGDVWDPIRDRIKKPGSRIRQNDASFLAYSLLDAIVDHCFPILEHYGDKLEEMEDVVFNNPSQESIQQVHELKREMLLLRRQVWPMREMIQNLQRESHECMSDTTRIYLRDVHDHVVQIIDLLETYREVSAGLTETYMVASSMKMNEIIKVMTVIATIFTPITFLASVYGMNFSFLPEKDWDFAYPMFWIICIAMAGGLLYWFKRRKWL